MTGPVPLAKQYPGLRRFTCGRDLETALGSEAGRRAAEDAAVNLARSAA